MATWYTDEAELEMIEMWRSEPLLFSTTSKGQSQRYKKKAATIRIADHFGTSVDDINRKMNSLRTQYCRHLKPPKSGNSKKRLTKRQEWIISHLSFLRPYIWKRRGTDSGTDESVNNYADTETTQDPHEMLDKHNNEGTTQTQRTQDIIDTLLGDDTKHNIKHDMMNGVGSAGDRANNIVAQGDGWKVEEQGVKRNSAGVPVQVGANGKSRTDNASGGTFLNQFTDYLYDSDARHEKWRTEDETRRTMDVDQGISPNDLWAKNLALQIGEIKDERKRRLLKIKVTQVVTEFQLEDLQNEES